MSRSNPEPTNPAQRFFKWKGSDGSLVWYDKENKQEVATKLPFSFLVLDQLMTMTGYSDNDQSGIWSNEVRSVNADLTVKTSAGELAHGTYGTIKDQLKAQGGKYATSVYIAYQDDNKDWVIGNIKMAGASLGAWFDFRKSCDVNKCAVKLTGSTEEKKGTNKFFVPTFKSVEASDADNTVAIDLDKVLQAHLERYLNASDTTLAADDAFVDELLPIEAYEDEAA